MANIDELREEELRNLNDDTIVEYGEEVNLEELILLGEDKKIPVKITFPTVDGERVKAKALVKQLTLREMETIKVNRDDLVTANRMLLEKALFKTNGEKYTKDELYLLPLGVVNALAEKIFELSGVNTQNRRLRDF